MKPHLPVRLFRAILLLMLAAPATVYASHTAPTTITIPDGYTEVVVNSPADIIDGASTDEEVAFRIDAAALENGTLAIDGRSSALMSSGSDSRYFTSDSIDALASLSFSNASTELLFYIPEGEKLQFTALQYLLFEDNMNDSDSPADGGVISGDYNSIITLNGNETVIFRGNAASGQSAWGGAIYGNARSSITLSGNGSVNFINNTAASGGAIAGRSGSGSSIILDGNDHVTFSENVVKSESGIACGGAIVFTGGEEHSSSITLNENGDITFIGNKAISSTNIASGGAIYSVESTILSANREVIFSGNSASSSSSAYGGAICGGSRSHVTLCGNEYVSFIENATFSTESYAAGGAIYGGEYNTITLNGNSSVSFCDNLVSSESYSTSGGAIYGDAHNSIELSGNGSVSFCRNTARSIESSAEGGAISGGQQYSTLTLSENENVTFSGNVAKALSRAEGGAIYGGWNSVIMLGDNGKVSFSGNSVSSTSSVARGGAICGTTITLRGNESVTFSSNTASSSTSASDVYGGAIYGEENSTITLSGNESVTFSGNTASSSSLYAYGGAIGGGYDSTITLSGNEIVTFSENTAVYGGAIYGGGSITLSANGSVSFSGNTAKEGGAICGWEHSPITLSGNGSVTFSGNTASSSSSSAHGGAIDGGDGSTITLSDNGSVTFSRNTASSSSSYDEAHGGAIYGGYDSTITLSDNGSVTFSGNTVNSSSSYAYGGSICTYGNLSIRNNDAVLFEKNAEIRNGSYRLRSIYAGGSRDVISLSAAEGKSIEFRDSIYIGSGSTVEFNADYTDSAGVVHAQKGDIIFTGAYTEAHLNELLADAGAGRVATAEEIRLSRRSEVLAMTNLYGGCLRVEDGAIYRGSGITAMEGSNATVRVKDATLNHSGYDLTFHSGTTLEIGGISEINGDIELLSGSTLNILDGATMTLSEDFLMIAETGSRIHLENNATLDLAGELEAGESVMVELSKGAAVSRAGISIGNMGGTDVALLDAGSFASGSMQKVENMHVVIDNNENTNIDYQLVNSSVENRGSGKLTVTHAQNSITAVRSEGGAIDILNVDTSDTGTILKLATLELHGGATFGAYTGSSVDAAQEAWVQVSGSAVFGKGTTINADLELMEGCSLTLGGTVDMGSNLRINGTLTLDGELLAQIQAAEIGASFDLFTGIDNLYLSGVQYDSIALSDGMAASTYFVGLEDSLEAERGYRLTYASATPGEGVLSVHVVTIPEPTTATLSFLALAGLMLRRRRK